VPQAVCATGVVEMNVPEHRNEMRIGLGIQDDTYVEDVLTNALGPSRFE